MPPDGEANQLEALERTLREVQLGVGELPLKVAAGDLNKDGRADLVVSTGGLGPTPDDLTREAIARVCGEEPRVDADLEAWLRELGAEEHRHQAAEELLDLHDACSIARLHRTSQTRIMPPTTAPA